MEESNYPDPYVGGLSRRERMVRNLVIGALTISWLFILAKGIDLLLG